MIRIDPKLNLVHASIASAIGKAGVAKAKFVPPPNAQEKKPISTSASVAQHSTEGLSMKSAQGAPEKKDAPTVAAKKKVTLRDDDDALDLDRSVRSVASMIPPNALSQPSAPLAMTSAPPAAGFASVTHVEEVQALANALVEKAAFWGDGARGMARLRFGNNARSLAGLTATLETEGDRVVLRMEGGDDDAKARIAEKLAAFGIEVE